MADGVSAAHAAPTLPRAVVILLGLAGAVVLVAGMRGASGIIGPLVLALVVTIAVQPLRGGLNHHLPRWLATLIVVVVVNAVMIGLAVTITVAVARFGTLLTRYQ